MRHQEFCYWLQGYFELDYHGCSLTDNQMLTIGQHIKLVKEVDKELKGFVAWLEGVLDVTTSDTSGEVTTRIKAKLSFDVNEIKSIIFFPCKTFLLR